MFNPTDSRRPPSRRDCPRFAPDGYHLTAHSAAISRGVDAGVATDIDGQPRDYHPDIGADEFYARDHTLYMPLLLR